MSPAGSARPIFPRGRDRRSKGWKSAWAIEVPGASAPPEVVSEDGAVPIPLTRIGDTDLYAGSIPLSRGTGHALGVQVDGKPLDHPVGQGQGPASATPGASSRSTLDHPDASERSDVPKGKVTQQPKWKSKIFDGTSRDWWVYVPAQYSADKPAAVMVFQDGGGYKDFVPTVFDNLIAKKEMPVTVGVFINPGTFDDGRSNRSFEYDTLSDQYARFLLEEILPEVEKTVKLRHDAAGRAIAGISSGGICAFTVAWERPNEFSKVLSWVGSFTNIASGKTGREGGHNYEAMVRKTPKKPIRVFLQDGSSDLDNDNGNWPLANQTWPSRWRSRTTTTNSSTARASTATSTAGPSCPTRSAGSGEGGSRRCRSEPSYPAEGSSYAQSLQYFSRAVFECSVRRHPAIRPASLHSTTSAVSRCRSRRTRRTNEVPRSGRREIASGEK